MDDLQVTDASKSLDDFLTEETVRAQVSAASRHQAVQEVGRLLLKADAVEESYIDAMERVLDELGPYAVIAPGAILLHARPEDGVNRPCFALVTLSAPVSFGDGEDKSVDLVFAFGAVDKETHLSALKQLAEMASDERFLEEAREASDDAELLAVIRSRSAAGAEGR